MCLALMIGADDWANTLEIPDVLDTRLTDRAVRGRARDRHADGLAVDLGAGCWSIESHTHFRARGLPGPPADRIRVFADTDGDGRADRTAFLRRDEVHMSLASAPDGFGVRATTHYGYSSAWRPRRRRPGRAAQSPAHDLETPGDYPHNGLSGPPSTLPATSTSAWARTSGPNYRLVGSDGTTLSGGGEGGQHLSLPARRLEARARSPPGSGTRSTWRSTPSAGCSPSTTIPTRGRRAGCCTSSKGATTAIASATAARGCTRSRLGTASCPARCRWWPARARRPAGVLAYESDNLPAEYRGDAARRPRGAITASNGSGCSRAGRRSVATIEPVVAAAKTFARSASPLAPDGSLYRQRLGRQVVHVHGKGRIWHLTAETPDAANRPSDPRAALGSRHLPLRRGRARTS